ncbi:MAG: hypothetical protein HOE80_00520 [Candidatus Magasanikbacteria bacterium]|nr:hypothetical protein [Candidatus Magasanikbacteria bacterium]MBT4071195.1 hypothetical protein [Candidatus Magasanikbacteria bacterium]
MNAELKEKLNQVQKNIDDPVLDLRKMSLTILPVEFGELYHIEEVYLGLNNFTEIPECLFSLKNLRILDISSNRLESVSPKIELLEKYAEEVSSNPEDFINFVNLNFEDLKDRI